MERRNFVGAILAVFCGVALPPDRRSVVFRAIRLKDGDPWLPLSQPQPMTVYTRFLEKGGLLVVDPPRVEYFDLDGDGIYETPALLLEDARTNSTRHIELDGARW